MRGTRFGSCLALAGILLVPTTLARAAGDASDADPELWRSRGRAAVAEARALVRAGSRAKNVIVFIGDGMGVSTVTAARILDGQRRGRPGEGHTLAFERLPYLALIKTYNTNQQVPDSAGTATALLTGVKTRAGVIGLDGRIARGAVTGYAEHQLPTLFEQAEGRGLATGVVTTTTLTHATPAAAYAHISERGWESDGALPEPARQAGVVDIARQLIETSAGDGIDVALGGGRKHFLPSETSDPEYSNETGARRDGQDLIRRWLGAQPGRAYVWNRKQLSALDLGSTRQLLGVFEPSHMRFDIDRPRDAGGEPSLSAMTTTALDVLRSNDKGFVLLVEGGRIDHGHHASSAFLALQDAIAFSAAVEKALERVSLDDTLVVVTADHGHTFSLGGYPTRGNPVLGLVVENDEHGDPRPAPALDLSGLPYTSVGYANGPGYPGASDAQPEGSKQLPHRPKRVEGAKAGRPDLSGVDVRGSRYLQESAVPLASETHAGEDVPLYAGGPGAHLFRGVQEQSTVYHLIVNALGWSESD